MDLPRLAPYIILFELKILSLKAQFEKKAGFPRTHFVLVFSDTPTILHSLLKSTSQDDG